MPGEVARVVAGSKGLERGAWGGSQGVAVGKGLARGAWRGSKGRCRGKER